MVEPRVQKGECRAVGAANIWALLGFSGGLQHRLLLRAWPAISLVTKRQQWKEVYGMVGAA